jgi:hypothetical protein
MDPAAPETSDLGGGGSEVPGGAPRFSQGFRWEGDDPSLLAGVIDAAFDYRGDVTLYLRDGRAVHGYLFNRDGDASEPFADVIPAAGGPRLRVFYRDLRGIAFSGKDPASGKSWETWVKKYHARNAAEARGERAESVDLFPETLD